MRPTKARIIGCTPRCRRFCPVEDTSHTSNIESVTIGLDMLEAMRLVDAECMSQEAASQRMDVSTSTLCRILSQGRRLIAMALINGKSINREGGNIMYNDTVQRQCENRFCHGEQKSQDTRHGSEGLGRHSKGQCAVGSTDRDENTSNGGQIV